MKRKRVIWTISMIAFVIICNFSLTFNNIAKLFGEGLLFDGFDHYVTKDKRLVTYWNDNFYDKAFYTDKYNYYLEYRNKYPNADTTLYRIELMCFYRFWRYKEYLSDTKWKQSYTELSLDEWLKIEKKMYKNREKYGTPFPRDTVNVSKK